VRVRRGGDQSDGVTVEDERVQGGSYIADVGWVRYTDGSVKAWRYGVEIHKVE
jgi:hypothetical protein